MTDDEAISQLQDYKRLLDAYEKQGDKETRSQLMMRRTTVEHIVSMAGCMAILTLRPPPAVGGPILPNVDPFSMMFDNMYGGYIRSNHLRDMIDESIGAIQGGALRKEPRNEPRIVAETEKNYAFIAMAINPNDRQLEDVLDAIKEAAKALGIRAERVDEQQANTRITDRILESIRRAEFVICDLTFARPNVYYEAGYAQGFGKLPIYVARKGTELQFDLRDYPVIFFESLRDLKAGLTRRLETLAVPRPAPASLAAFRLRTISITAVLSTKMPCRKAPCARRGHLPIAKGSTSPEPHSEHFHRRASQATVVQGLWSAMSSSIAHRCSWSHRVQRAPIVATLRCCWSAARDTSQVSRDFSSMATG
jgi:hypothetical protein